MKLDSPLWQLAFRPGFLFASAFSCLAIILWLAILSGLWQWQAYFSMHWWHGHEMLFGFAMPVVTGFLLTAVRTWTNGTGTTGLRLQLIFACWLIARLLLVFAPTLLPLAAIVDSLFIFFTLIEFWIRVWPIRQWRNIPISIVLVAMLSLNIASYVYHDNTLYFQRIHYALIFIFTLLITVIGGRVIPFFTANKLQHSQAEAIGALDISALLCLAASAIWVLLGALDTTLNTEFKALLIVAAILQCLRWLRWRGWQTISVPLLWSLHCAYLLIPVGLISIALLGSPEHSASVMHLLAIGVVGNMILAMMARVALGHTGRPLLSHRALSVAFILVSISALLRSYLPILAPTQLQWAWVSGGAAWALAFAIYLYHYHAILTSVRPDGKPG